MREVNCPKCRGQLEIVHWPYAKCRGRLSLGDGCGLFRLDDDDGAGSLAWMQDPEPPANYADTTPSGETIVFTRGPRLSSVTMDEGAWVVRGTDSVLTASNVSNALRWGYVA